MESSKKDSLYEIMFGCLKEVSKPDLFLLNRGKDAHLVEGVLLLLFRQLLHLDL